MLRRTLGSTGLEVSVLGLGAGQVGAASLDEDAAGTLLNRAVDRGVTLVDTARGYGLSEDRIGRHLSWRRRDFVLVTKVGYDAAGARDWTGEAIVRGTEQALGRLRTDAIDVVLLHSCEAAVFERDDVQRALEQLQARGLARFVGYSGENEDLDRALRLPLFSVIETSLNLVDQRLLDHSESVRARGVGAIAKRPLANAFWRFDARPVGDYCEEYWARFQAWKARDYGLPMDELALRFALSDPLAATAIVGTSSVANLEKNVALAEKGPLPAGLFAELRAAWAPFAAVWPGRI